MNLKGSGHALTDQLTMQVRYATQSSDSFFPIKFYCLSVYKFNIEQTVFGTVRTILIMMRPYKCIIYYR